jgi:hypothetical protein
MNTQHNPCHRARFHPDHAENRPSRFLNALQRGGLVLLITLAGFGCATGFEPAPAEPGTTFGRIYIDTPEVYSRERLVNDRFMQDAWLRAKLDEDPTQGLQGSRSESRQSATTLALGVGTQASPPPGLSSPGAAAQQQLSDSPIERFRDVLAYREEVRTEMLENQLDDRHDIAGNTLYRLKFDATVVPLKDTSAYAMVEVTVKGLSGDAPIVELPVTSTESRVAWEERNGTPLPDWEFSRYLPRLDARTIGLYNLSYMNWVKEIVPTNYSQEELQFGSLQGYLDSFNTPQGETVIWEKKHCEQYRSASIQELVSKELLARGVPLEYQEVSTYYEETHYPDGGLAVTEIPQVCVLTGLANFIWDLRHRDIEIYTYAVTPKERVQRVYGDTVTAGMQGISVGAEQDGIGAALAHSRAREARANAILRQPQLVGYSPDAHHADEATMGWLIGPRYKVADDGSGSVSFRHVPTQVSLTGVISVPSWWTELTLVTRTYWLDENGREYSPDGRALSAGADAEPGTKSSISLPGDVTTIAEVLDPKRREPRVDQGAIIPQQLVACERGSLVIPGQQLWRSTVVTLGGSPASSISVLPNMKGLVATFDQVQPSITGSEALFLWTSEGGVHAGDLRINGPGRCEQPGGTG